MIVDFIFPEDEENFLLQSHTSNYIIQFNINESKSLLKLILLLINTYNTYHKSKIQNHVNSTINFEFNTLQGEDIRYLSKNSSLSSHFVCFSFPIILPFSSPPFPHPSNSRFTLFFSFIYYFFYNLFFN